MFRAIDLSTSSLVAHRTWMDTIAGNIAQANSTVDPDGKVSPFRRRFVTFSAATDPVDPSKPVSAVNFEIEVDESTPPRRILDPQHPHADADGYVAYPNIDALKEQVNMMLANRAYEANVTAIEMSRNIAEQSLRILG